MKRNIGELIQECAEKYEDSTALEMKRGFRTDRFSYSRLYDLSLKTASLLKKKGIRKGDRVVIWSPNILEWVMAFFGSLMIGAIVVPLDSRISLKTCSKFMKETKPKLIFKSKFVLEDTRSLIKETVVLEDLVDVVKDLPIQKHQNTVKQDDVAEIVFTSGTTAEPKGVILTHENLLFNVSQLLENFPIDQQHKILSILPLSHMFEQIPGLLVPLSVGAQIIYIPKLNFLTIRKTMKKKKITAMMVVPQILRLFLDSIEHEVEEREKRRQWQLALKLASSLPMSMRRILFRSVHEKLGGNFNFFCCGAAPLDMKLLRTWEKMGIPIYQGYGATETTAGTTMNTPYKKKEKSVGKVLSGAQVKIDENGEILIRGKNISSCYFENPKKTKTTFENGWFKSGDIGYLDEDNFLYLLGRNKFKIVLSSGENVYPEDIEKKLKEHPLVWDCCVLGVPKKEGDVIHTVVITKEPKRLKEVIQEVNKKLEIHQQIREFSVWPKEDFPRTRTMKIDREKVKDFITNKTYSVKKEQDKQIEVKDKLTKIVSIVCKINPNRIKEDNILTQDLGLDSLRRVLLVLMIEEELGISLDENLIDQKTTISSLRKLVNEGSVIDKQFKLKTWPLSESVCRIRKILQNFVVFPAHRSFAPIVKINNRENLKKITTPSIFIFNHIGEFDAVSILRVLPPHIRDRLSIITAAWGYEYKIWGLIVNYLLGNAFPLRSRGHLYEKIEKEYPSLEIMGELLDLGWSVLISPEGKISPDGKLQEFKPGAGMMAVEMRVPVVPFKIEDYFGVFPSKAFWPKKKGKITITVGEPISFSKYVSYIEATKIMKEALENL